MPDKKTESNQIDKFKELARELEVDDDEAAFKENVRKIAQVPAEKSGVDDQ